MLERLVDAAAVEAEIERVQSLSGDALRRHWQSEFGRPLPRSLSVHLLRRMIANRIQEEAFGTLDRATLKLLDGLARANAWRWSASSVIGRGGAFIPDALAWCTRSRGRRALTRRLGGSDRPRVRAASQSAL